jgi:hypothetical protein
MAIRDVAAASFGADWAYRQGTARPLAPGGCSNTGKGGLRISEIALNADVASPKLMQLWSINR